MHVATTYRLHQHRRRRHPQSVDGASWAMKLLSKCAWTSAWARWARSRRTSAAGRFARRQTPRTVCVPPSPEHVHVSMAMSLMKSMPFSQSVVRLVSTTNSVSKDLGEHLASPMPLNVCKQAGSHHERCINTCTSPRMYMFYLNNLPH